MKSVIVFAREWDYEVGTKYFTESAEFGIDCKYPSAAAFVKELQTMYTKHGNGNFTIDNVVIG